MSDPATTLVLGGARSGKSRFAEDEIERTGPVRIYLATGTAGDPEMAARIAEHRARRGEGWQTVEEPVDIAPIIATAKSPLLVDCLTLWLSNLMMEARDIDAATHDLLSALDAAPQPVVLVSNEIGLGLVPDTPLGRRFRDAQGRLNQQVAATCKRVIFVAAGLPLFLKGAPA